jgi:hypothetical protein
MAIIEVLNELRELIRAHYEYASIDTDRNSQMATNL